MQKKIRRYVYLFLVAGSMLCVGVWFYIVNNPWGIVPDLFPSLSVVQAYAESMDEYPPIDNTAWADPDYSSFLQSTVPSLWDLFLYKTGLKKWPGWHAQGFAQLIHELTNNRESQGLIGRYVLKMKPAPGSSLYIWGDLQGAFHSLVRDLQELYSQGIIDERFHIKSANVYFVFNGDLVNRSAYSLETLSLVMVLMERNPSNVFYMRGNHEDGGHWKNFSLKRDLMIRAARVSDEAVPLETNMMRFFNTLPLALYLVADMTEEVIDLVRISHIGRDQVELQEQQFAGFFDGPISSTAELFKLTNKAEPISKQILVRVVIRGEPRSTVYRLTPGLVNLEADKGATTWVILSCPTESYRHLQDFYYDAFARVEVGPTLPEWTITLYNQDVRELLGFRQFGQYNLLSGLRIFKKEEKKDASFASLQERLVRARKEIEALKEVCPEAQSVQNER